MMTSGSKIIPMEFWRSFAPKTLYFLSLFGACSAPAFIFVIYSKSPGFSSTQIGLVAATPTLVSFLAAPIWSSLADRMRIHRILFCLCYICSIAALLCTLFYIDLPVADQSLVSSSNSSIGVSLERRQLEISRAGATMNTICNSPSPLCRGSFGDVFPQLFKRDNPDAPPSRFWPIFLLQSSSSFFGAAIGPLLDTWTLSILSDPKKYGQQRLFGSISCGISTFVVGLMVQIYQDWRLAFWIYGVMSLIFLVCAEASMILISPILNRSDTQSKGALNSDTGIASVKKPPFLISPELQSACIDTQLNKEKNTSVVGDTLTSGLKLDANSSVGKETQTLSSDENAAVVKETETLASDANTAVVKRTSELPNHVMVTTVKETATVASEVKKACVKSCAQLTCNAETAKVKETAKFESDAKTTKLKESDVPTGDSITSAVKADSSSAKSTAQSSEPHITTPLKIQDDTNTDKRSAEDLDFICIHFKRSKRASTYQLCDKCKNVPRIFRSLAYLLISRQLLLFNLTTLVMGFAAAVLGNFVFIFLTEDLSASSVVLGITAPCRVALEIPMFYFAAHLMRRFGLGRMMLIAQVAMAVRCFLYTLVQGGWMIWLVLPCEAINGITFGAFYSAAVQYANEVSPPGWQATMQGVLNGFYGGLGSFLGSVLGGVLYQLVGPYWMFRIVGIVTGINSIVFYFTGKDEPLLQFSKAIAKI